MQDEPAMDLDVYLTDESLTEGQRKRLGIFKSVENGVCARIEELCGGGGVEVTDVAVLVIAPSAHEIFFGLDTEIEPGTNVVLGHRDKLYAFLNAMLPATPEAPFDPYADLLEPAPARCVRAMVIDHESLTVMSYGTFVTIRLDSANRAVA